MNNMQDNIINHDDWDAHWQELSKDIYFNTPAVKYRWRCINQLLQFDNADLNKINLIDFGCGSGNLLKYIAELHPTIHVKGTDNSLVGLQNAKKSIPHGEFFQADLLSQPLDFMEHAAWATHAICSEVLEHLDDPVLFLKNAGQFLRPQASLCISVPGGPMSQFDHHVGHRKHYTGKILEKELKQAGYKIEKIACAGFPFYNLYRLAFILRGKRVFTDVKHHENDNLLIKTLMKTFSFLFKFNRFHSSHGWIILAKASWQGNSS